MTSKTDISIFIDNTGHDFDRNFGNLLKERISSLILDVPLQIRTFVDLDEPHENDPDNEDNTLKAIIDANIVIPIISSFYESYVAPDIESAINDIISSEDKYLFPKFANNTIQYNSVKLSGKINTFNNKKFRIGFVGRADKEKGLEKFLEIAFENKNNFVFNIFSNSRLRLNNNQKKYVNFFYNKDISKIYKNMDILLVTSPIENCPFSILEAKSYGIPTLVYLTKGGVSEIVKNNYNGLVITSIKNNLKIIDYINRIKVNYKFFSNNAYVDAKKYNAESKIPKLIKNELLK